MFKTLSGLTYNAFWRVSADTKRCGSPLYPAPAGGLRSPAGEHTCILTDFQTKANKKVKKITTENAEF